MDLQTRHLKFLLFFKFIFLFSFALLFFYFISLFSRQRSSVTLMLGMPFNLFRFQRTSFFILSFSMVILILICNISFPVFLIMRSGIFFSKFSQLLNLYLTLTISAGFPATPPINPLMKIRSRRGEN